MKKLSLITLFIGLMGFSPANAIVFNSSDTPLTILDGNSAGIENTIFVSGQGNVLNLTVTLNISGGRNGDLYAYLIHDSAMAVLLNRVGRGDVAGGYNDTGFQIMFQDGASDVHTYQTSGYANDGQGRVLGTFEADGRDVSPFSATTASPRVENSFGVFSGGSANGNWTLFIADVNGNGNEATLDSWSLDIAAVPEPANVAMALFGGIFATVQGFRLWKKKKSSQP